MIVNEFTHDIKNHPTASLLAIMITAIGLTTTFLILVLYVTDRNTDRIHPDHQRLYRIESQFNLPNGDKVRSAQVPLPLIDALQKHPGIDGVGYAYRLYSRLYSQARVIPRVTVFAVNPALMSLLRPYRAALPAPGPHDIYITADFNRQYLGYDAPLGKTVNLGERGLFTIKAIVEPQSEGSLNVPAMIAFSPEQMTGYDDKRLDWYDNHVYAFVRLKNTTVAFDQQLLDTIVADNAPQLPGAPFTPTAFLHFSAKNSLDMHYNDGYPDEFVTTTTKSLLHTLYAAALFVLLTTVANFFNINAILNTAKRHRWRIKRSIGASDTQLLAESLTAIIPQFLAIVSLAALLLCALPSLSPDIRQLLAAQEPTRLLAVFFGAALCIGLMVLSSHLLSFYFFVFAKNATRTQNRYENPGAHYVNQITLMLQLLVAGIMVYLWAGVMTQSHYVMDADFGYQRHHRLTFPLDEEGYTLGEVRDLQNRLKETMGTSAISLSSWRPFDMSRHVLTVQHARQQVKDQFVSVDTLSADAHFVDVWGLATLAGEENPLVASRDSGVCHAIVTRAFMQAMGQDTYDEVLNNRYYIQSGDQQRELRALRIVENISLGEHTATPQPLIIFINDRLERFATLSYPENLQSGALVEQIQRYGPQGLLPQTAQELHDQHYHHDVLTLNIVKFAALSALLLMVISTIIIGISEMQRLDKTLKIMEAVGGSIYTSLVFFLRQNVLPMLLSLLIALVVGFSLLQRWLRHYDTVAGLVYAYAFAALLLLGMAMAAIMALTLVFNVGRLSPLSWVKAGRHGH